MKRFMLCAALTVAAFATATAQIRPKNNPRESELIFWNYPDNYLQHQRAEALEGLDNLLLAYPPSTKLDLVRRMALMQLDLITHDRGNDNSPELTGFIARRITHMLDELQQPVKKGIRIFKLYNDGYIIKSRSATIGIDIVRGGKKNLRFLPDSLVARIAGSCDMLLITHKHGDHCDPFVIACFKDAGKPVFEPIENALPSEHSLSHGVHLQIVPGHQDKMPNNIYFITNKEGFTITHTGDQSNEQDLEWVSRLHEKYRTDVLLIHCWSPELARTVKGFSPRFVIPGHENELEHSIDHREAYWMSMKKFEPLPHPIVHMTWGESWSLKK